MLGDGLAERGQSVRARLTLLIRRGDANRHRGGVALQRSLPNVNDGNEHVCTADSPQRGHAPATR